MVEQSQRKQKMLKQSNPIASAMWKWVLSIFAGIFLLFFTALSFAQTVRYPSHLTNAVYGFDQSIGVDIYNTDMHITIHEEVEQGWGYYAMYWFTFQAGIGGYSGLQKSNDPNKPKIAIFSIWDAAGKQTAMPVPGTGCQRFGHEGSGTNCLLAFNWKSGVEYKIRIWKILNSRTNYSERWGAWVINVKTGEETLIGVIEVYNAQGQIGYGSLVNQGYSTVLEVFDGPINAQCSDLPYFGVTWKGPYGNNGTINPATASAGHQTGVGTMCQQTDFRANAPFSLTQEVGKGVVRDSPIAARVWTNYDKQKLDKIDCVFNWAERQYSDVFKQAGRKQKVLSNSVYNLYYRDYKVNGKGSSLVADILNDKLIKSDSGNTNTPIGTLSDLFSATSCN